MNLIASYVQISGRIDRRRKQADSIISDSGLKPWERRFLSESLISNLWLDWSTFVKQVLIASCNGSPTRSGSTVVARAVVDNSEARIRHEIKRIYKNALPVAGQVDAGNVEPTWAHSLKIVGYVTGLAPSNASILQGAFGAGNLPGHKMVHLVRNACAHKSLHNRNEVASLKATYMTSHFLDPIDIIWGTNSVSQAIAFYEWLSDMETMADIATN